MTNSESSQDEVGDASVTAFKMLYGGKVDETLTTIRLELFFFITTPQVYNITTSFITPVDYN